MASSKKIYNLIILDESGSMESIKTATIAGFNELIQSVQAEAAKDQGLQQFIQQFSFNSVGIIEQIALKQVDQLLLLTPEKYRPNAQSPLYDAIGHAVGKLRYTLEKEKDCALLVTIFSDGA